MSEQLRVLCSKYFAKHGRPGQEAVASSLGITLKTLRRWIKDGAPDDHKAYKLARELGVPDEDAVEMATKKTG